VHVFKLYSVIHPITYLMNRDEAIVYPTNARV